MNIKYKYIYVKRQQKNCKINSAADVDKLVGEELRKLDREYLLAIYLNSRNKVIDIEVVAICTLFEVPVHPREVIKSAILVSEKNIYLFCFY